MIGLAPPLGVGDGASCLSLVKYTCVPSPELPAKNVPKLKLVGFGAEISFSVPFERS